MHGERTDWLVKIAEDMDPVESIVNAAARFWYVPWVSVVVRQLSEFHRKKLKSTNILESGRVVTCYHDSYFLRPTLLRLVLSLLSLK